MNPKMSHRYFKLWREACARRLHNYTAFEWVVVEVAKAKMSVAMRGLKAYVRVKKNRKQAPLVSQAAL